MSRLNVALAYHAGDLDLAKNLLRWISDQNSGPIPRAIMLFGDGALTKEQRMEVKELAKTAFQTVKAYPVHVEAAMQKWPTGPNLMFMQALRVSNESMRDSFLWLEPDCVTLKPGWLESIERDYYNQPCRYFGVFSHRGAGEATLPERWMSGVGVYPSNAFVELAAFCGSEKPFDVVSSDFLVPRLAETQLIAHFWGTKDLSPTFVHGQPTSPNAMNPAMIPKDAVIFHRCKDGSLMRVLSQPAPPPVAQDQEDRPTPPETVKQQAAPVAMPPPKIAGINAVPPFSENKFGGGLTRVMKSTSDEKTFIRPE